jgi:iron complex transport system substrate-binding protein
MKKQLVVLTVLIAAAFLWPIPALAGTVVSVDKLGRSVSITTPVKRAVFFETYELIPALNIWDRVVGISRYAYGNDLMKAAKPDIAETIPSAGSGFDVNMEALLKLNPELVITWASKPENIRFMREKGLAVYALYPESLQELFEVMRFHGRIFDCEKRVEFVIAEMDRVFGMIKKRVSAVPVVERRKVLWISSRPTSVACGIGVNQDLITMINGVNPAGSIKERSTDVSMEQIIAWNPDVIFIWGNAKYTAREIMENPQWRFVKAVRDQRVFKAPEWSTWSPRLAPIVLWMAARTYPERFRDVQIERESDIFYRRVFGLRFNKVKGFAD